MTNLDKLRKLEGFIEAHPEFNKALDDFFIELWVHSPNELNSAIRALASCGTVYKEEYADNYLAFSCKDVGLKIICSKENTGCKKVKVTRQVEEWQCPDSLLESIMETQEKT